MSINAMTNAAVARRPDFEPAGVTPKSLIDIAKAAGAAPTPVPAGTPPAPPAAAQPAAASGPNAALQTLTTYIPTEVLTLYVRALAAIGTTKDAVGNEAARWIPFYCFLGATPIAVWIAFATKLKVSGKSIPATPTKWPVWEMAAATSAFSAWAFALPNTPFDHFGWYSAGLAGFLVPIVSWGLGVLAPLMQRPLPA